VTDATDLWDAVVASYDEDGLVALTNIRKADESTIDDTVGENAAQGVLNLWPAYAQVAYDGTDGLHVEVAKRGVIAMLQSRGGVSVEIAKIEWDEVFGDNGTISKVRKTGPRGHQGPATNSGVQTVAEDRHGPVMGWGDRAALPNGILPNTRSARGS